MDLEARSKMTALMWRRDGGLTKESVIRPIATSPRDSIVKVAYCGVCGTDLHILSGSFGFWPTCIMGHEIVGIDMDSNERVFVNPIGECGSCDGCHTGKTNFCRLSWTGDALGIVRDGGWAQYMLTPKQRFLKLPADIPLEVCALCEPLSCVVQGLRRLQTVECHQEILVLGAGIIGILFLITLYHRGLRKLTAVELSEKRRKVVDELGLQIDVHKPDDIQNQTFDIIIDCTGNSRAFDEFVGRLRKAGKYLIFGCPAAGALGKVDLSEMVLNQWKIFGSRMNPYTNLEAVALMKEMFKAKLLDLPRLGVGVFPLSDFRNALEALQNNEYSKVIFKIPQ